MRYELVILPPGQTEGPALRVYESGSPFLPIGRGDWVDPGSDSEELRLRVTSVSHRIGSEVGQLTHQLTLFTVRVFDCPAARSALLH